MSIKAKSQAKFIRPKFTDHYDVVFGKKKNKKYKFSVEFELLLDGIRSNISEHGCVYKENGIGGTIVFGHGKTLIDKDICLSLAKSTKPSALREYISGLCKRAIKENKS